MSQPPETPDSNGQPGLQTTIITCDVTGKTTATSADRPPCWFVQLPDGTRLLLDDYLANRHLYDSEFDASDLPDFGPPHNGEGTP